MSFLDILNKKQLVGGGQTATEQAGSFKQAIGGKETSAGGTPAASQVSENVATAQVSSQKKQLLQTAQTQQQKVAEQFTQQQQVTRLDENERAQRRSELLSQNQQKIQQIHQRLSQAGSTMDDNEKEANLEQLSFLHGQSDRKWADSVVNEGTKRRLDDSNQMKEALLYATFSDNIDQLNSDNDFKRMLNADDREFQQSLARISPEYAIESALKSFSQEQSQRAYQGMVEGVQKNTPAIAEYAAKKYTASGIKGNLPQTAAQKDNITTYDPG